MQLEEKISGSELEIMKVLWDAKRALSLKEIRQAVQSKRDWNDSTIKTLLRRLHEKEIVKQEKKTVFLYTPMITKREYNQFVMKNMMDNLFSGSARNMVASMVQDNLLTPEDVEELQKLLKGAEDA